MVRLPCGQIHPDVCLRVGFAVVARIGVQNCVFLGILEKVRCRPLGRRVLKRVLELGVVVCAGVVESTRNATLCRSGSTGTDSNDVSSCSEI